MSTHVKPQAAHRLLENLSEEQRRAVTTTDGPVLIVAGPGSGKTRVIIQRIAYVIDHLNADPRRIMAVTFTNRAANEMVERLSTAVRPEQAKAATVSTFHRLCGRLNHALAPRVGLNDRYSIYDRDDQIGVVKRAMELADIDAAWYGVRPGHILSRISGAKSRLMGPEDFARSVHESGGETDLQDEAAALAYPHYQRELQQANALDFDDIILKAIHILQTSETARLAVLTRYRYVMVDEYQDTNVAQNVLTDLLAGDDRPNL